MRLRVLFAIHGPSDPATAVFANVGHRKACLEAAGHQVDLLSADDLRIRWVPARLNPIVLPLMLLGHDLASYDAIVFHSYLGWAFHALRWLVDRRHTPATVTMFHGLEPFYHRAVADELERQGRPVSLRFRLLHHVLVHRLLRFACSRSEAVFCLNTAEARYLASHHWVASERVQVVNNAIEPIELAGPRDYSSGTRLVNVAQWLPVKGNRYLVDAFTSVARAHPDVTLTCAGTGAGVDTVLAAFPEDLRSRVTVLPRLDRAGIFAALQNADIFVFPSLCEGFSLALIEALATGLPVVCTGVGAAPDILHPGIDALLVPEADAPALAAAVERLIADAALRRQLGESGRSLAMQFSWTSVCPDYRLRLSNLVKSHAGR